MILLDALGVVGDLQIRHPRLARVHATAAELLRCDVLTDGGAHQVRSCQRHRAAPLDHQHEVGEPRDVGGTGRARSHHGGDLRHDPAHHDLVAKQLAGAGEQ